MVVKNLAAMLGLILLIAAAQAQTLDPAKIKSRDVVYVPHKKLKAFPIPILEYQNDKPQYEKLRVYSFSKQWDTFLR